MAEWSFLTNHARVLLCIALDPGIRLRDIAATVGITERTAFGVVADLTDAGYVIKERDGRRNRYEVQHHLPLAEPTSEERTIGDVLELLGGRDITRNSARRATAKRRPSTVEKRPSTVK
jgi:DNA-binding transcriptional ArsR family regulator